MSVTVGTASTTRGNTRTRLPYEDRYWAIEYTDAEGAVGETRYPINYEEVYNLKGRLLTLVDATFTDPQQRKAFKDMVWQTLRTWIDGVSEYATEGTREPAGED